jgi:septal ring factor EnvC (AmiA/AmiB activator)
MIKVIIIWGIIFYILYNLLSKYILPVVRVTSAASSQMRKMQQEMAEMNRKMSEQQQQQQQPPKQQKPLRKDGDYIDYEEVK